MHCVFAVTSQSAALHQVVYDTHDPEAYTTHNLGSFFRRRSKIVEIVAAKNLIFALTQTGVCVGFDSQANKRICFLNTSPDEVIRSLFYNKTNNTLITVSVYRADNFSSLNCRSSQLESAPPLPWQLGQHPILRLWHCAGTF